MMLTGNWQDRLIELRSMLMTRGDQAYCDMIALARKKESLGWEAKVACGKFGKAELDAHIVGGELLGRHRAMIEACREIDCLLRALREEP